MNAASIFEKDRSQTNGDRRRVSQIREQGTGFEKQVTSEIGRCQSDGREGTKAREGRSCGGYAVCAVVGEEGGLVGASIWQQP